MNKVDEPRKSGNEVTCDLFVEVPRGWSRGLEKDSVVYISPSSECLRSKEDVVKYLVSQETCKCGLDCPLYVDKIFNFDANIPSRHFRITQWDKAGHRSTCKHTLGVINAFKHKAVARAQASDKKKGTAGVLNNSSPKPENAEPVSKSENDNTKVQLPSFETFTRLSDKVPDVTLQGQTKTRKPSQSKRTGCYRRKSSSNDQVPPRKTNVSEESHKVQECITVHSTNTPIPHSYVKSNVPITRSKDVVSSMQYTPRISSAGAAVGQGEQRHPELNLNSVSFLSFPPHLNASSYLASLSSGTSSVVPNRTPSKDLPYFPHASDITHTSVSTASVLRSFSNTTSVDYPSFSQKQITSIFAGGTSTTNNIASSSGSSHTKTNNEPTITFKETPNLSNVCSIASSKNSLEKVTLGKSKGGFSMKTGANVRDLPTATSGSINQYSPQFQLTTVAATLPVYCGTTTTSAKSYTKTHVNQPETALCIKSMASGHVRQTSRINNTTLSEKGEPVPPNAVYPAAIMTSADKHKQRTTAVSSKSGESLNPAFQYCGILLQPTAGMIPQVQVAGTSGVQLQQTGSRSPNLGTLNIQSVDPSQFANLYAFQGIPCANNVGTLGNSGAFGVSPGTVVPYVLGIAPTGTTTKSTTVAETTITTKVSSPSSGPSSGSATSTGSAAIAAAYSAFVSIAPASATSSSYSQQLMNLVNSYNNPYWQQLLAHSTNSNALAYQLMQMNQYAALRCSAGQPVVNTKSPGVKYSVTTQHQAKQASTTTTVSSLGSNRTGSQGVMPTPVALVVVGPKDLSSVSSSSTTTDNVQRTTTKTSSQPTTATGSSTIKSIAGEKTNVCESSVASILSTSACKVNDAVKTVACSSKNDNMAQQTRAVPSNQDPVDIGLKKHSNQVNSRQNDAKMMDTKEAVKSVSHISHDLPNKEGLSVPNKNAGEANADDSLTLSSDNDSRTCESSLLTEEVTQSRNSTDEGSSALTTDSNCVDVLVEKDKTDECQTPDDDSVGKGFDVTNTVQVSNSGARCMEGNDLTLENNLELMQSDGSEENEKDGDELSSKVTNIVQNGEAENTLNDVKPEIDEKKNEEPDGYQPAEFTIGDVVWAQARGLPSWPGKIVDEPDVGSGKADNGKKWVMWFGDHTFSQVEVEKLKTLSDGLKTLDDKGKKRKYRGKKTRIGLEQAIGEALEELDQRDRLRSRQGSKAKKRKLRL